jgi:hypothetical protein
MEAIINLLQAVHLDMLEVSFAGLILFYIGYRYGLKKVKKLTEEIYSLQREVLDLNAELLAGKDDIKTPVIEIKHEALKNSKMAK